MYSLSRNSCATAFGNWSRRSDLRLEKSREVRSTPILLSLLGLRSSNRYMYEDKGKRKGKYAGIGKDTGLAEDKIKSKKLLWMDLIVSSLSEQFLLLESTG